MFMSSLLSYYLGPVSAAKIPQGNGAGRRHKALGQELLPRAHWFSLLTSTTSQMMKKKTRRCSRPKDKAVIGGCQNLAGTEAWGGGDKYNLILTVPCFLLLMNIWI